MNQTILVIVYLVCERYMSDNFGWRDRECLRLFFCLLIQNKRVMTLKDFGPILLYLYYFYSIF